MKAQLAAAVAGLVVAGIALAASAGGAASSGGGAKRGPMQTIRRGSTGEAVRVWQGVVGAPVTGTFDESTGAATRAWQAARGLEPDEVVGPKSWAAAGYSGAAPAPHASGSGSSSAASLGDIQAAIDGASSGASGGGGSGGHAWAKSLPQEQSMAQPEILAAVQRGEAIYEWVPLTLSAGGHTLTIEVLARALRVGTPDDSVAVTVDFDTATAIAEHLGAYLLTPRVMRAIFDAADVKVLPYPSRPWQGNGTDNTGTRTFRMVQHSDELDAKGVLGARLAANEGKGWVITIRNWTDPNVAKRHNGANHGFFDASGKAVQDRGLVHNRKHVDYSQLEYLMKRHGTLDGVPGVDLRDVVRDPATAGLLSDEGRLPDLIHPDLGGAAA